MTFNAYQQEASKYATKTAELTSQFPIVMWALGLAGETGELVEKVKKLYRDHNGSLTTDRQAEIAKEAGDVLWYLSTLLNELGLKFNDVAQDNLDKLESRINRGVLHGTGDNR